VNQGGQGSSGISPTATRTPADTRPAKKRASQFRVTTGSHLRELALVAWPGPLSVSKPTALRNCKYLPTAEAEVVTIRWVDPSAVRLGGSANSAGDSTELRLSSRQAQILERVSRGMSDREIAADLGCSYRTVRTHLERVYAANGIHSRAAAAVAWVRFSA